jgi:hypothetical protein
MKRLIILLLVVLIPSLCFGRSVYLKQVTKLADGLQYFAITDSVTNSRTSYTFKVHSSGKIFKNDNKEEFERFDKHLYFIFKEKILENKKEFLWAEIISDCEFYAVTNNWQVTEYWEKETHTQEKLFLYKQDK